MGETVFDCCFSYVIVGCEMAALVVSFAIALLVRKGGHLAVVFFLLVMYPSLILSLVIFLVFVDLFAETKKKRGIHKNKGTEREEEEKGRSRKERERDR